MLPGDGHESKLWAIEIRPSRGTLKIRRWSHHLWDDKKVAMNEFLTYVLVPVAIIAVAVVLLLGLTNMMRGGSPHTSQKLMRLRVLLQFIALVVIMITIWAIRG
jgi:hypothetical protein